MNKQTQKALKMAINCMKWLRLRPNLSILPETEAEKMCKAALQEYKAQAKNRAFEDDAMYYAWRKLEAYQVPATEEGTRMMHERAQAFIAGWLASKSKGEKDE